MSPRATISLCMIARDEARVLETTLARVVPWVDEVVLVDTGSRDATCAIARGFGARIVERAWDDDFAAPRNEALSHATGAWILVLDADERLAPNAGPALRRAVDRASFDLGFLRLHDASTLDADEDEVLTGRARIGESQWLPRLFRRTPELRWVGRVHEAPTDWLGQYGRNFAFLDVDLIHVGRAAELVEGKAKVARNVALLERRIAEEPDAFAGSAYLAQELLSLGDEARARAVADEGYRRLEAGRAPTSHAALRLVVARAMLQLAANDAAGVRGSVAAGERRDGAHPDYEYLRGAALELESRRATGADRRRLALEASARFEAALVLRSTRFAQQFVRGSAGATSELGNARALVLAGDFHGARVRFEAAQTDERSAVEARLGLAEIEVVLGDAGRALAALEPLLSGDAARRPDPWLLAALAAERLGALADAEALAAGASARLEAGYLDPRRAELHVELLASLALYRNRDATSASAPSLVVDVACRRPLLGARPELAWRVGAVVANLARTERFDAIDPFLEPAAEAAIPGARAAAIAALAELGIRVEEGAG
jgi:hypothetical protein